MNNYTPTRLAAAVVLAMMVTACGSVMRSEYQRPAMTLPEHWQQATSTPSQIPARWWQVFQDPQLDRMLTQLRQSNPDLARLVSQQLLDNALIAAGLLEDARDTVKRMNALMEKAMGA